MTVLGAELLRAELEQLKSQDRPAVIKAIAEARAHGDLKENAEYHAAREKQGFVEGRIKEIEAKLAVAQIIDVSRLPDTGKIVFGAQVKLLQVDNDVELEVQIVGEDEADPKLDKISLHAPLARELIGKEAGEAAEVRTAGKVVLYEVLEVKLG